MTNDEAYPLGRTGVAGDLHTVRPSRRSRRLPGGASPLGYFRAPSWSVLDPRPSCFGVGVDKFVDVTDVTGLLDKAQKRQRARRLPDRRLFRDRPRRLYRRRLWRVITTRNSRRRRPRPRNRFRNEVIAAPFFRAVGGRRDAPAAIGSQSFEQRRRKIALGEGGNDQHDVLALGFRAARRSPAPPPPPRRRKCRPECPRCGRAGARSRRRSGCRS